jgi:nucleotide-binding universal stress UspA family protein
VFGRIQPVIAWHYPWWAVSAPTIASPTPPPAEDFAEQAGEIGTRALHGVEPDCRLPVIVHRGRAGQTLTTVAKTANLLVVGSRGHGAVVSSLLGSVSSYCVSHCDVPVVVIPSGEENSEDDVVPGLQQVVVGVDGSDHSIAALVWAIDHLPEDSEITAINTWNYPVVEFEFSPPTEMFESSAQRLLADAVSKARSQSSRPDRAITTRTEMGDPRFVLRDNIEADLIVLGARGRQGVAHLLLGSTATAMTHNPRFPTVIVPS